MFCLIYDLFWIHIPIIQIDFIQIPRHQIYTTFQKCKYYNDVNKYALKLRLKVRIYKKLNYLQGDRVLIAIRLQFISYLLTFMGRFNYGTIAQLYTTISLSSSWLFASPRYTFIISFVLFRFCERNSRFELTNAEWRCLRHILNLSALQLVQNNQYNASLVFA